MGIALTVLTLLIIFGGIRVLKDQCAVDVADIIAAVNELRAFIMKDGKPRGTYGEKV